MQQQKPKIILFLFHKEMSNSFLSLLLSLCCGATTKLNESISRKKYDEIAEKATVFL